MGSNVKSEDNGKGVTPKKGFAAPGMSTTRTTSLFRIVNFELFMKPNKYVMGVGLVVITGCAGYLMFMNVHHEKNTYVAISDDGSRTLRVKTSRWD